MVSWLIITVMTLIAALIMFFLNVLDDKTREDIHSRVEIAFSIEKDALFKLNVDYSYWDESYDKTIRHFDSEWVKDTYDDYLIPSYGLTYVAAISKDKDVTLLAQAPQDHVINSPQHLFTSSLFQKVTMVDKKKISTSNSGFFSNADGKYYIVAAEPYRDETSGNIVDGSFLILAKEINPLYLKELSSKYKLPALSLNKVNHNDEMDLDGVTKGASVGKIYWDAPTLSSDVLPYAILILVSLMIATVTIARLLLSKDYQNRELYEGELYLAATTDPLTSIANRRQFLGLGRREIQLQIAREKPLSLVVFDLDHFKSVNDEHGHAAGDAALKHFTELCAEQFRETDIFARLGGEEFGLILPSVNLDKATRMTEQLRDVVSNTPLEFDGKTINLTVSVGIATWTEGADIDQLLSEADKALYLAKNSGRNTVCCYDYSQS